MGLHATVSGTGATRVVLVHGFTQTGRSWAPFVEPLAADHEVMAVDAPGHGDSGAVRADLVEGAELLADAGGRAVYVGYSMGGRLALHLAVERPELVDGLVLIGASPGIADPAERAARKAADDVLAATIERDGVDAFLDAWLAQPLFATLPADAADVADRRRNTAAGLASSLRLAGTGAQAPLHDRLHAIDADVLLVAGANDARFTAIGSAMARAIGRSARVVTIAGAGHAAHREQPEAFLELLQPWLTARR